MALAGLIAAGCGETAGGEGKPSVVATTSVAADIVSRVAGADVELTQLVPDGSSPHSYAPSAREQAALADSDLLVYFSPALEQALPLEQAENSFAIAEHSGAARTFKAGEIVGGEEDAGSLDPHVWLDPTAVAAALPDLAEALAEIDPEHATAYRARARAYGRELGRLDSDLARIARAIPAQNRKLVTSHDLLGYFADRYGFEIVGAPFGSAPEAEASAGDVAALIDLVRSERVPAVFAQQGDDPEVLRLIASEAGVEVVDDLLVETLGDDASSYEQMMRLTTQRIADALAPGS